MSGTNRLDSTYQFLASKRLALILFSMLCLSLVPGTFAEKDFHVNTVSRALLGLLGLNLLLCTARRIRTLPRPVLVTHLGAILIIAGAVTSSFGYIATVNVYEGTAVDTAYRWDLERNEPLGFDLSLRKIGIEYYPVPVRVGVLKGTEKFKLEELRTGESFSLGEYTVRVDSLELPRKELLLSVFQGDRLLGTIDTGGTGTISPGFPYGFRLVAYQNPVFQRVRADLSLSRGTEMLAEGTTEVNSPFGWNRLSFHLTQIEWDPYGAPYAGIQVVKDPGTPIVYTGFAVLSAGALLWGYNIFSGRKRT